MPLLVTEYTDPGCPWAWSMEPMRWRLRWLYRDGLRWQRRMIGLTSSASEYEERGFTPERVAAAYAMFSERYGMPLPTAQEPRLGATLPACRAVVAARLHAPAREEALLRRLRVAVMTRPGARLDDPATIAAAAGEAGIPPAALERWLEDPAVERALAADMAAARDPAPAALALRHKLAEVPGGGWRYTAPSLVFETPDGARLEVPGFQPSLAYEVAVANLDPELARHDPPGSLGELLAWAGVPLATREVGEVMELDLGAARAALDAAAEVVELPAGSDAFWALAEPAARAA